MPRRGMISTASLYWCRAGNRSPDPALRAFERICTWRIGGAAECSSLAPQPLKSCGSLRNDQRNRHATIRQAVWGPATFVDLDRSLNVAIAQIRLR
jgi:hypothetical protein